jgi:hypothetical protein
MRVVVRYGEADVTSASCGFEFYIHLHRSFYYVARHFDSLIALNDYRGSAGRIDIAY